MGLHAVRAGDHQHRIIQHLQGALSLGGKIHMSRRVQQGQLARLRPLGGGQRQHRLLGKNRNAPRPLPAVGIQKCVPVIHAAQLAQYPRAVKQPLGQCGFAAVHMGQQPNDQSFHTSSPQKIKILSLLYNFSCHLANALLHPPPLRPRTKRAIMAAEHNYPIFAGADARIGPQLRRQNPDDL